MFELFVLGMLALIVVGPKDLPKLMRGVGQAVGKVRRMADEFRTSFDQMAHEAEMEEMRQEIDRLKKASPVQQMSDALSETEMTEKPKASPADQSAAPETKSSTSGTHD